MTSVEKVSVKVSLCPTWEVGVGSTSLTENPRKKLVVSTSPRPTAPVGWKRSWTSARLSEAKSAWESQSTTCRLPRGVPARALRFDPGVSVKGAKLRPPSSENSATTSTKVWSAMTSK